ncbi:MAG TPA: type II toxin-antitoxin system prevent-host-death family antitoxin [Bauldia sp.]|nr:type II toxin-antitoxin system prevent-host-death family antitoxin [Bauldia sp.]
MTKFVTLYEAKDQLSELLDRAAAGEEIVIAKSGMPFAKLAPLPNRGMPQKPASSTKIAYIDPDLDTPDPEIERPSPGKPGRG